MKLRGKTFKQLMKMIPLTTFENGNRDTQNYICNLHFKIKNGRKNRRKIEKLINY